MRTPIRFAVAVLGAAVLGLTPAGPQAVAGGPAPGAPGGGDRLFPGLGNGGYDAVHYDLAFDWDAATRTVAATTTVHATATQALSRFDLDLDGNTVERVRVDGRRARYARRGAELVVTPPTAIPDGRAFAVEVGYRADPRAKHHCPTAVELPTSAWQPTPDGFGLAGQPGCAHSAFPSNDLPSDKATYTIEVTTPKNLTSVANGTLRSTRTTGGRITRTFTAQDPIATELVQVAVGNLRVYRHAGPHGLPLRDVVPTRDFARSKHLLDQEAKLVRYNEAQIGTRYPFETFGSLGLHSGFAGALETQTLVLYPADFLAAKDPRQRRCIEVLMSHELTHQWFGDSVSPRSWSDIWLNEGHATYYEYRYGTRIGVFDGLAGELHDAYRLGDEDRHAYGPVARPTSRQHMFGASYDDGALVLYALHEKVGDQTFRRIERRWVTRYANRSPGTADYIANASRVSGRDLGPFLRAWLYGTTTPPMPGHPGWKVQPVTGTATATAKKALC